MQLRVKNTDEELQILYAEAYAPSVLPDADGDVMTAEEIRAMAYRFMIKGDMSCVDTQHNREINGSVVVESFIARDGDPVFIAGSWVVGIYVPDPVLWADIKNGVYKGLSLDFDFFTQDVEYEVELPEFLTGETEESDGHVHTFTVRLGENGEFLGGETNEVNGHRHPILHGTRTLRRAGHDHTFSFVELLSNGQVILVSESTAISEGE
ncbi:hypothetical protein [Vibrio phage LV6]|nr:hypothetical protein [Vibrio phage LV6]